MTKKRIYNLFIIISLIICSTVSAFGQTELRLDKKNELELTNEIYRAEVLLEAGKFVRIETNSAANLTTKIFDSSGNNLADDSFWRIGTNSKFFVNTKEKGIYRIELKFDFPTSSKQPVDIFIRELRNSTESDSKIIDLQNLRREVKLLSDKKDAEIQKLSLQKNETALELAKQIGDKTAELEILTNIGYVKGLSETEKGTEILLQAVESANLLNDKPRLVHANFLAGINYAFTNKPNQELGLQSFKKCVELGENLEFNSITASCSVNIGGYHQTQGNFVESVEPYERAVNIFRKFGIGGELVALQNLIVVNTALGNVPKTLQYYTEFNAALASFNQKTDCQTSLQIGFLQYNLQNWKTAREIFKETRSVCQSKNVPVTAALALIGEGASLTGEGEIEKALPILNYALEESRNIKSKQAEAISLAALGVYYDSIGDSVNALKFSESAKPLLIELNEPTILTISLITLGKNYLQTGEVEKAETNFKELLAKSRQIRYAKQEAAALFGLAQVADKKGDLLDARKNIEDSIKLIEASRGAIPTDALRVSFFASVANYYDFYTDLLMRLHRQNPDSELDKLAFQTAESSDARSLLNQLQEAGTDIRKGVPPELLAKENRLRQELNAQNARQLKMLTTFAFPAQLEKVRNAISRLNAEYEQTQAQIVAASPAFAALTQPKPLSLSEIQNQLDANTVLLKYSLGEERSRLFAVTNNSFKTFELPKRAEIEAKVWNFRRLLTVREQTSNIAETKNADKKLKDASANLAETLLGKLADQITDKCLAIVPSGALQFIPFSALQNPKNKGQFLIESNEITILPSVSVLAFRRKEKRGLPSKTLAVFADPVYEKDDPRLQKVKENKNITAKNETRGNELTDFLKDNSPKNFQRLIYSRREANQILALVPNASDKFSALDFSANHNSATGENLRDFKYLHFAAHGIFDAENPQFSGIILSLLNEKGESENGLLSLQDVYNLRLNSDLVVLSACRTGLGKQVKGEGVVGLTRGFMYAGSRRIVASLWKVQDDATAELMTVFYRNMLQNGKKPAEAMRLAQIYLLKNPQFNSPFFWAAFVHYGEWQ
jgi:CHAT domain-containing protein/tetratricopeptide (TPR) repeat protein